MPGNDQIYDHDFDAVKTAVKRAIIEGNDIGINTIIATDLNALTQQLPDNKTPVFAAIEDVYAGHLELTKQQRKELSDATIAAIKNIFHKIEARMGFDSPETFAMIDAICNRKTASHLLDWTPTLRDLLEEYMSVDLSQPSYEVTHPELARLVKGYQLARGKEGEPADLIYDYLIKGNAAILEEIKSMMRERRLAFHMPREGKSPLFDAMERLIYETKMTEGNASAVATRLWDILEAAETINSKDYVTTLVNIKCHSQCFTHDKPWTVRDLMEKSKMMSYIGLFAFKDVFNEYRFDSIHTQQIAAKNSEYRS